MLGAFAALAETAPDAALARLRRLGTRPCSAERLPTARWTQALSTSHDLWAATGVRPLQTAVGALDPALRDRFDQLSLLFGEPPLAKSLRRLIKLPATADAYAQDRAARGLRRAIGHLAIRDDPVIARALAGWIYRAAALRADGHDHLLRARDRAHDRGAASQGRRRRLSGYRPRRREWPVAARPPARSRAGRRHLGVWDEVAEHGLRVPASWLAGGNWPALWARAHR